jgi:hypothetical protein
VYACLAGYALLLNGVFKDFLFGTPNLH